MGKFLKGLKIGFCQDFESLRIVCFRLIQTILDYHKLFKNIKNYHRLSKTNIDYQKLT